MAIVLMGTMSNFGSDVPILIKLLSISNFLNGDF